MSTDLWVSCRARAKVIVEYHPESKDAGELALSVGDVVVIQYKSGAWYKGYLKKDPDFIGVFHSAFVHLDKTIARRSISSSTLPDVVARTHKIESSSTDAYTNTHILKGGIPLPGLSHREIGHIPITIPGKRILTVDLNKVDEETKSEIVTSDYDLLAELDALSQEWSQDAQMHLVEGRLEDYLTVQEKIGFLLEFRRVLIDPSTSSKQLDTISNDLVQILESSRRGVTGFIVPRDKKGQITDIHNTPIPELLDLHRSMVTALGPEGKNHISEKLEQRKEKLGAQQSLDVEKPNHPLVQDDIFHLQVEVKALAFFVGKPVELYFNVWDVNQKKFMFESYSVSFNDQGVPNDFQLLGHLKGIFKNLTRSDLSRDLYLVVKVFRIGGISVDEDADGAEYRRPVGCAVLHLNLQDMPTDEEICPLTNSVVLYSVKEERNFAVLHELILKHSKEISPIPKAQGIALGLVLKSGKSHHDNALEYAPALCRKNFFDGNLLSSYYEPRNDFYVTLNAVLISQEKKRTHKHIQVTIEIVRKNGTTVENCIRPSKGQTSHPVSIWSCSVQNYNTHPVWHEQICIRLPSAVFDDCHLLVKLWNVFSKPEKNFFFAYSFIPLNENGAVLQDGTRTLETFKPQRGGKVYLNAALVDLRKDTVSIETCLVSSSKTQKSCIQQILAWKEHGPSEISKALNQLMSVEASDFAKFLRNTFDAIFDMICQFHFHETRAVADSALLDTLFKSLLHALDQLTSKFVKYQQLVDSYIETYFKNKDVHVPLLDTALRVLQEVKLSFGRSGMKTLMLFCKMLRYFFKLVMKSFALSNSKNENEFKDKVFILLSEINGILVFSDEKRDVFIGCKGFLFRSLPFVFNELETVFSSSEMGQAGLDFLQTIYGIQSSKLTVDKLVCVLKVLSGPLCSSEMARLTVEPLVVRVLRRSFDSVQVGASLDECFLAVASLKQFLITTQRQSFREAAKDSKTLSSYRSDRFKAQSQTSRVLRASNFTSPKSDTFQKVQVHLTSFHDLLPSLVTLVHALIMNKIGKYRLIPVRSQIQKLAPIELMQDSYTCLATLLFLMDEKEFMQVCSGMPDGILEPTMDKLLSILHWSFTEPYLAMYPNVWIVMVSFKYAFAVHFLSFIDTLLSEIALSPDIQLKSLDFIAALLKGSTEIVSGSNVNLENVIKASKLESRKEFLNQRFQTVRQNALQTMQSIWNRLGSFQMDLGHHFCLALLPQLLFDCGQDSVGVALGIFGRLLSQDMVRVERYTFNLLYSTANTSKHQSDHLYGTLKNYLEGSEHSQFLSHLEHLYELMSSLFTFPETELYETERTEIAIDLMKYIRERDNFDVEIYAQYVQYLETLHVGLGNYTEAGLVVFEIAENIGWTETLVNRVSLYEKSLDYFERSSEWELCIQVLGRLQEYYEKVIFKYDKVASILRRSATLFEKVVHTERFYSVYFRVCFYGKEFENGPREVVFKGNKLEKNIDFTTRIKNKYPNAYILMSSHIPSDEEIEEKQSILSITTLHPSSIEEMKGKVLSKFSKAVHKNIQSHYKWNNVNVFTYRKAVSRSKESKPSNEFKDLWVHQTFIKTADTFPFAKRVSPVIDRSEVWISPIEGAVAAISEKNIELEDKIERLVQFNSVDVDIGPLSMTLNGTIDAAVNGGTQKYIEAFLCKEYIEENPGMKSAQKALKKVLKEQLDLLKLGLEAFSQRCGLDLKGLLVHLKDNFGKMKESTENALRP